MRYPGIKIRETRIIVQLLAQTVSTDRGREIPAYTLSVPEDISPEMRPLVAAPPAPWALFQEHRRVEGTGHQGRGASQDAAPGVTPLALIGPVHFSIPLCTK